MITNNGKPNILLVDDNLINLELLEVVISTLAVNIITALSGKDALEKVQNVELALAILDVRMPEMDGYELAVKINQNRPEGKVPILFITASHINECDVFKGYNAGAIDYISKPYKNFILLSKVRVFIDLFHQKQSIIQDRALLKQATEKLTKANRALKKSEEKFKNYIENAPDGIFIADETGKYIEVNKAACRITGYSKSELLHRSIKDMLTESSLKTGLDRFKKLAQTKILSAEYAFRHKDGSTRWWAVDAVKLSKTRFLGFTKDITERKQAEIELEETREKYRGLSEASFEAILISEKGVCIEQNLAAELMFGYTKEEAVNRNKTDWIVPEDREMVKNKMNSGLEDSYEVMALRKNGTIFPCLIRGKMLHFKGKNVRVTSLTDITNLKNTFNALKISEEKYKTTLNASPDGILLVNLKGLITEVSEIGLELVSAENKEELIGKHYMHFVPKEETTIVREIIDKTMSEGIAQNIEIKIRKQNSTIFLSEISSTLIQGPDGTPYSIMITVRDISQRKKLEKTQIHADRMASLGEMASGIAHEINQPLNTLSLTIDNILYKLTKEQSNHSDYLKKKSEKIFENITRIRNIIDHVRAFSRNQDDSILSGFDVNQSILNAVSMISEQFKHLGITLKMQLTDNPPSIIGNTFQFEQVVINLLTNAKDALLKKKEQQQEPFEMLIIVKSYLENQCLIVEVLDNGIGISEEDIEHIMLPFYTTKDTGKGTGLGLSISYQIIKSMNGTIEILDNEHQGASFKINLCLKEKLES